MDDITAILEEKSEEIYETALREYREEHPGDNVDDETKQTAKQLVTSQLLFSLGNVTFSSGADKKETIDEWYTDSLKRRIAASCKRRIAEERAKKADTGDDNLSVIERHLRKHGMSLK